MKALLPRLLVILALAVLAAYGYVELNPAPDSPAPSQQATVDPALGDGVLRVVENVAVRNYGKVVHRGAVDLTATIARIRAGERHSHRNDGSVFGNRERLLPSKPRGYYREYVHPTEGISGPGPQRIVVGRDGDWWYTPDHYASFVELGRERSP